MIRTLEFLATWRRKTALTALVAACALAACPAAEAALVVDLSADSGTSTTVDGAVVDTWDSVTTAGNTTFTRSGSDARYVADSGGGIPAVDFDRSAPFAGDFSGANGAATIGDATIFVWANFDGYTDHGQTSSSYYFSIDGSGNEHTLGRDGNSPRPDYLYSWDGGGEATGVPTSTDQPQPAGWNLYIARFFGASLSGTLSMEAWIDAVGDGQVVANNPADLVNEDSVAYDGNASALLIGTWTNSGSGLDGQIRPLQIYNTILSDADVGRVAKEITGVPEPASIALLIVGMFGVSRLASRRN